MKFNKKQWPMMKTWWTAISNGIDRIANLFETIPEGFKELIALAEFIARRDFDPHKSSCGNCVFAYREEGAVKECRVNPPVRTVVADKGAWIENTGWPKVGASGGCGKHRGFSQQ